MLPPRAGGGNGQGHNHVHQETSHRTLPRWGPEMESTYSLKTYITDLQLWSMMTDLAPYQQLAAVILRLSGATKPIHLKGSGVPCPKPVCCQAPWDGMPQARSVSRNWPGMFEGRARNLPRSSKVAAKPALSLDITSPLDMFGTVSPCVGLLGVGEHRYDG